MLLEPSSPPHAPPQYPPGTAVQCLRCAPGESGTHSISSCSILQMISGLMVHQPVRVRDKSTLSCIAGIAALAPPCPRPQHLPLLCSSLLPPFPVPTASSCLVLITLAALLQTQHLGTAQTCARGGLAWTRGCISLPRGWSNTATGFLERWSMPQA